MTGAVTVYPGAATATIGATQSIVALYGPMLGGIVRNPATTLEQGIAPLITTPTLVTRLLGPLNTYGADALVPLNAVEPHQFYVQESTYGPPENLYLSLTGPITLTVSSGPGQFDVVPGQFDPEFASSVQTVSSNADVVLAPGQQYPVPAGFGGNVWVASVSAGHRFSAVIFQPATQYPPTPYAGAFPPAGPVTRTTTIPSYLYQQYTDDDDLQALVAAQNAATQDYVDTFNALNLPDFTGLSGGLLDWVVAGLYGLPRPTFFSGFYQSTGPLNTVTPNAPPALNGIASLSNFADVAVTSDDVYKRVLTWHLWRGDGRQVSASWIRRRVVRFLFGEQNQGSAAPVSVVSDESRNLSVTVITGVRQIIGGAMCNAAPLNEVPCNAVATSVTTYATPARAAVLKEGIDTGALEMPGQYHVTCRIGIVGAPPTTANVLDLDALLFGDLTPPAATYIVTESGLVLATERGVPIASGPLVPVTLATDTGSTVTTQTNTPISI